MVDYQIKLGNRVQPQFEGQIRRQLAAFPPGSKLQIENIVGDFAAFERAVEPGYLEESMIPAFLALYFPEYTFMIKKNGHRKSLPVDTLVTGGYFQYIWRDPRTASLRSYDIFGWEQDYSDQKFVADGKIDLDCSLWGQN